MTFLAGLAVVVMIFSALYLTQHGFHDLAAILATAACVIVAALALLAWRKA